MPDGYPIIVEGDGEVHGELYYILGDMMKDIREYEEVNMPDSIHEEREVSVILGASGLTTSVVALFASAAHTERIRQTAVHIPNGKWKDFIPNN